MSANLKNKASEIRSRDRQNGAVVAAAIEQAAVEIDGINIRLAPLTDPIFGFKSQQNGSLFLDALAARNLTKRFLFDDAPDTQAVAVAGYQVLLLGDVIRLNNTSGGSLALTSTPTIAAGKNLQRVELINISAQNIVLQDNGTLAGSTLRLGAATRTLKTRCLISLRYSTDIGGWLELFFANNL